MKDTITVPSDTNSGRAGIGNPVPLRGAGLKITEWSLVSGEGGMHSGTEVHRRA